MYFSATGQLDTRAANWPVAEKYLKMSSYKQEA